MAFLTEPDPIRGQPLDVIPGVQRIVADNPGPMTYHGTNTYLIETPDGLMVLDPGPDDADHIDAIARATEGRANAILLSHGHQDHCAGAARLKQALGVPLYGYSPFDSRVATIDVALAEGETIGGMQVIFTPGHASDHICFMREDGIGFTGDHVMAWSSSVVPYPSGDMGAFIKNLERLEARHDRLYLPGHGPTLENPSPFIATLVAHRMKREREILEALAKGINSTEALTDFLYAKRGPLLKRAAEHNVKAHLAKLLREGRVAVDADIWRIGEPVQ